MIVRLASSDVSKDLASVSGASWLCFPQNSQEPVQAFGVAFQVRIGFDFLGPPFQFVNFLFESP